MVYSGKPSLACEACRAKRRKVRPIPPKLSVAELLQRMAADDNNLDFSAIS